MIYQCLFFRDIGAILSEVCSFCVPEVAVLVASPEWEIKVRHKSWRLVSARVMTCFYIVAEFCTMYFRCIHNIFGWICMKYLICIIDSTCITWLYQFYHVICEYIYIYIFVKYCYTAGITLGKYSYDLKVVLGCIQLTCPEMLHGHTKDLSRYRCQVWQRGWHRRSKGGASGWRWMKMNWLRSEL